MELLFSRKMANRSEFTVSRLSGIFPRLFMFEAYTIFKSAAYRKPYWKCLVKYSAHFLNNAMQARFWSFFMVSEHSSINNFLDSQTFTRLSYRLTFIMLNVGMVRQRRILVDNFTHTWQSRVITFLH